MNQELTQRIIGAVVVTALAAIFVPMLFDGPAVDSGQLINPLEIPEQQFPGGDASVATLPETPEDIETTEDADFENPADSENPAPELSDQEMMAEPPADAAIDEAEEFAPAAQESPKPAPKKAVAAAPKQTGQTSKTSKPASDDSPAPTSEKPKPELTRYYLQAGSFSKQANAQALADKLKNQGMPVFMETIKVPGKGTFYRLRVGPELDKNRALTMQKALTKQKIDSLLMSE